MNYTKAITETFNLPEEIPKENLQIIEKNNLTTEQSLIKNKEELFEVYRNAKKLLDQLLDNAIDVSRPRDIEALSQFMRETTETLKKIKEIDMELLKINNNKKDDPSKIINNFNFKGSTRDLIEFVKELRKDNKETSDDT